MKDFEHLILLIGTNPLPNLVVADYFLQTTPSIKTIWLLCSEKVKGHQAGTIAQAKNLEKVLKSKWKNRHPNLSFPCRKKSIHDVSDAQSIRNTMGQDMLDDLKDSDGFHLNYTGGTKSMCIHTYWLLNAIDTVQSSCSYLDARNFRLIGEDAQTVVLSGDLRKDVRLSFEDLIDLHGFERTNKDDGTIFSHAVDAFEELILENQLPLFYDAIGGYDRSLFTKEDGNLAGGVNHLKKKLALFMLTGNELEALKKEGLPTAIGTGLKSLINKGFSREDDFCNALETRIGKKAVGAYGSRILGYAKNTDPFTPNDAFKSVVKEMPEEFRIFDKDGRFDWEMTNRHFKNALKFLDGFWLEDYVAECIRSDIGEDRIDIRQNWEIRKREWTTTFELDIPLINGYQLTGISCTTDQGKDLCKNKGFEIMHRTRQIGGDETKAILITRLPEKKLKNVQMELIHDTGGSKNNILVLGADDLKKDKLINSIESFIL